MPMAIPVQWLLRRRMPSRQHIPWLVCLAERLRTLRELLQPVRLPKLSGRSRSSGRALPARTNCFGDLSYAVRCPCLIVAFRHHLITFALATWHFRRVSFRVPGNKRERAQSWHALRKRMTGSGRTRRIARASERLRRLPLNPQHCLELVAGMHAKLGVEAPGMAAHGTCLVHPGRKGPHPAGLRDGGLASCGYLAFLGAKLRLMSQVGPRKDPNCPKVCVITLKGGYGAVGLF